MEQSGRYVVKSKQWGAEQHILCELASAWMQRGWCVHVYLLVPSADESLVGESKNCPEWLPLGFWIRKIYFIVCPFFTNWIGIMYLNYLKNFKRFKKNHTSHFLLILVVHQQNGQSKNYMSVIFQNSWGKNNLKKKRDSGSHKVVSPLLEVFEPRLERDLSDTPWKISLVRKKLA